MKSPHVKDALSGSSAATRNAMQHVANGMAMQTGRDPKPLRLLHHTLSDPVCAVYKPGNVPFATIAQATHRSFDKSDLADSLLNRLVDSVPPQLEDQQDPRLLLDGKSHHPTRTSPHDSLTLHKTIVPVVFPTKPSWLSKGVSLVVPDGDRATSEMLQKAGTLGAVKRQYAVICHVPCCIDGSSSLEELRPSSSANKKRRHQPDIFDDNTTQRSTTPTTSFRNTALQKFADEIKAKEETLAAKRAPTPLCVKRSPLMHQGGKSPFFDGVRLALEGSLFTILAPRSTCREQTEKAEKLASLFSPVGLKRLGDESSSTSKVQPALQCVKRAGMKCWCGYEAQATAPDALAKSGDPLPHHPFIHDRFLNVVVPSSGGLLSAPNRKLKHHQKLCAFDFRLVHYDAHKSLALYAVTTVSATTHDAQIRAAFALSGMPVLNDPEYNLPFAYELQRAMRQDQELEKTERDRLLQRSRKLRGDLREDALLAMERARNAPHQRVLLEAVPKPPQAKRALEAITEGTLEEDLDDADSRLRQPDDATDEETSTSLAIKSQTNVARNYRAASIASLAERYADREATPEELYFLKNASRYGTGVVLDRVSFPNPLSERNQGLIRHLSALQLEQRQHANQSFFNGSTTNSSFADVERQQRKDVSGFFDVESVDAGVTTELVAAFDEASHDIADGNADPHSASSSDVCAKVSAVLTEVESPRSDEDNTLVLKRRIIALERAKDYALGNEANDSLLTSNVRPVGTTTSISALTASAKDIIPGGDALISKDAVTPPLEENRRRYDLITMPDGTKLPSSVLSLRERQMQAETARVRAIQSRAAPVCKHCFGPHKTSECPKFAESDRTDGLILTQRMMHLRKLGSDTGPGGQDTQGRVRGTRLKNSSLRLSPLSGRPDEVDEEAVFCLRCGKFGHVVRLCPTLRLEDFGGRRGCPICRQHDHTAEDCPLAMRLPSNAYDPDGVKKSARKALQNERMKYLRLAGRQSRSHSPSAAVAEGGAEDGEEDAPPPESIKQRNERKNMERARASVQRNFEHHTLSASGKMKVVGAASVASPQPNQQHVPPSTDRRSAFLRRRNQNKAAFKVVSD